MEIKIKYEELWNLIMQLPTNQLTRLKEDLATLSDKRDLSIKTTSFQEFLSQGPLMTEGQYEQFQENRKYVNE
ncbi:MAG: hypothetical protein KDD01_27180, partial [Phaeodactylibacter sp.]|nr:hypothetical protein [Phaeodactylibacter sp.]